MTAVAEAVEPAELTNGYYVEPETGAWCTLPWPGDKSLPYNHKSRIALIGPTLGPGVIRWCERWLIHYQTGEPWKFTPGQRRFLILWYSLNSEGRWKYRSGVKRGAKGTGKDPFSAAMALAELCGPVRFAGWDAQQRPIGERHGMPLVQIAANSEAQAADVLRVAVAMISQDMKDEYQLDLGLSRVLVDGGGRLELLTSSQKTAEGDPATCIILQESHHMTESSGGHKLAAVARRNVGKSPAWIQARLIEFTNAHQTGMDSVAEQSFQSWQNQLSNPRLKKDVLYDSREAPPNVKLFDDESRLNGIRAAYSDAPWADIDRLNDEVLDIRTTVADSIRFYLNGLGAAEDSWVDPGKFDACARTDAPLTDGDQIALFLDCSKSGDATGLVACRISDGFVSVLGVWQPPPSERRKGWLVPRETVDAVVREAFARFRVVWFGVDPSPAKDDETEAQYWGPLIDQWHQDFRKKLPVWATGQVGGAGHSVLFDMRMSTPGGAQRNRDFTAAAMQTAVDIDEGGYDALTHDGHPALRVHTHNARRRPNQWGVTLGKENRDSRKHVDLAVCMVGARHGRRIAMNSGKLKKKSGTFWGAL